MFADTPSFTSFAVDDIDAARRFYGETLGVNVSDGPMGVLGLDLAGGTTMVYPKPDFTPATYTVLNFRVEDIEAAVDGLSERGVEFERYDDSFEQDDRGIARAGGPAIAWFKDPAGNILSVLRD